MGVIDVLSQGSAQPLNDAFCVFGGLDCSFNEMLSFVRAAKEHQFIFGGGVWLLPKRINADTRFSAPVSEDQMVIVGKVNEKSDFVLAYERILRPFEVRTWIVFFGYLFGTLFIHVLLAKIFASPSNLINVCRHILLDFTQSRQTTENPERNSEPIQLWNKVAVGTLLFAVTTSSVVGILFYEISVVNFLFTRDDERLEKELSVLPLKDLEQYVVIKNDGAEIMFRALVGDNAQYIKESQLCSNATACYAKIDNTSDPAKLFFTFQSGLRHAQKGRKTCDLTAFRPRTPLSSIPQGWYYGPRISKARQMAIDIAISDSRLKHKFQSLINDAIPGEDCSAPSRRIEPPIIGWILATVIGLCMIPIVSAVIATVVLRRRTRQS